MTRQLRFRLLYGLASLALAVSASCKGVLPCDAASFAAAAGDGNLPRVEECVAQLPVDAPDSAGVTPLMRAAARGHLSVVRALLGARANVDASTSEEQFTPLMFAAHWAHLEIADALVAGGATVHKKDKGGREAIDWAALRGAGVEADQSAAMVKNLSNRGATFRQPDAYKLMFMTTDEPRLAQAVGLKDAFAK